MTFCILVAVDRPVSPQTQRWLDQVAVAHPVFELRPDYNALILVAEGLRPGPSDEATGALLSDAEAGRDLAVQLTALHPGARLSWRQIGPGPGG